MFVYWYHSGMQASRLEDDAKSGSGQSSDSAPNLGQRQLWTRTKVHVQGEDVGHVDPQYLVNVYVIS